MALLAMVLGAFVTTARAASPAAGQAKPNAASRAARAQQIRRWHAPPRTTPSRTPEGRPVLVLEVLNTGERIELSPQRDDGGFSAEDLARAKHALRDHRTGEERAIELRVLDIAYRLQRHFDARAVRVLSGFRADRGTPSNHTRGRALDLVIPGHRDDEVAAFARTLGFMGVGLYLASGFVHVDSRPQSYFWVDTSGPGQRPRMRRVAAALGARADARALARDEKPPTDEPTPTTPSDEPNAPADEPTPDQVFNASVARPPSELAPGH